MTDLLEYLINFTKDIRLLREKTLKYITKDRDSATKIYQAIKDMDIII